MERLRQTAAGLLLLSFVTHTVQFLFFDASPTNTPVSAAFGLGYGVTGGLLLRPGRGAVWAGAILAGIGAILGGLGTLASPDAFGVLHAAINWTVFPICTVLLFRRRAPVEGERRRPGSRRRVLAVAIAVMMFSPVCFYVYRLVMPGDPFMPLYEANCAQCHGEHFEGAPLGTPLVGRALVHGDTVPQIAKSIAEGFPATGMPGWSKTLSPGQIQSLAILVAERRSDYTMGDFKVDTPLVIPEGTLESEEHDFRIEVVATGLDPLPFSIAPLPDGRILVTEKTRGLRIVSKDGVTSALVEGTPAAHDDGLELASLVYGRGWLMDVALHPDYEENGWIYLHFGDRCEDCGPSMNKLVRARIEDGRWVDEETIWQADPSTYTRVPDMGAGGRIAFDAPREGRRHVYLSIGIKGRNNYEGIQDLARPYGKIHRVYDDGAVPADNPFVATPGALPSTWTYGHRSPQGLEVDPATGRLWSTEMGPRGGDELNLLRPGRNYGWPLTSKGVNYDGTPVEYGKILGIEPDLDAIEQPVLDMTPSPAISSFVVYDGEAFPGWKGNLIAGTLKATELYRWVLDDETGERVAHTETLLAGIARIRDVETAPDGTLLLLLEHGSGGQIVRLAPN